MPPKNKGGKGGMELPIPLKYVIQFFHTKCSELQLFNFIWSDMHAFEIFILSFCPMVSCLVSLVRS